MAKEPEAVLEEEKNIIYGYSERGIINSLIFNIGEDKELMKKFISLISIPNEIEIGEPEKYTILLEQSFSRFGDSDLVIIIHYKKPEDNKILFFEGKVKTYKKNWNIVAEFGKYITKIKSKNYWSNLFSQLYLKKTLFDNWTDIKENGGIKLPSSEDYRKIGNNPIVMKAFDKINGCKEAYYIGLIPTLHKDIQKFIKNNDTGLHFLSWEKVERFCIDNQLNKVVKIFEYNEGQIY